MSVSGRPALWTFKVADLSANAKRDVASMLGGEREARIMRQKTRVVGYYSELRNWNRSKLAELADRHKGEYGVPEGRLEMHEEQLPRDVIEEQLARHSDRTVCELSKQATAAD